VGWLAEVCELKFRTFLEKLSQRKISLVRSQIQIWDGQF